MATCSYRCDWKLSDILKTLIRNTAGLETIEIIKVSLQLISFIILISCLAAESWLSGGTGNQGLWTYCFKNGTASCCGSLYDVIGQQGFIDATRAFLIIECLLYLGIFYTIYKLTYRQTDHNGATCILSVLIAFCTFLAITIYGARHSDVRGSLQLNVSFAFCALNLGVQIIFTTIGIILFCNCV